MGTLYIKIACASAMMGPPNFWLRRVLERVSFFYYYIFSVENPEFQ